MLHIHSLVYSHIADVKEAAAEFDQHPLQGVGTDDSAEDINERDVSITDAMQQNHVPDKVRVRLLPEGFLSPSPDRGDDGGNVERLGVRVKIIVQRVIAYVAVERNLDVILSTTALAKDCAQLPAKIALDFENNAGELALRIVGSIREELPHCRKDKCLSFAGTDGPDNGDPGVEATLRQGQPMWGR